MKLKIYFTALFIFIALLAKCQDPKIKEEEFATMRKWVVALGLVVKDSTIVNGRKIEIKKFSTIGSGLMTYCKYKGRIVYTVVTAGHVVKFFRAHNINPYIRPAAIDTFKITEHFGIQIPLVNSNGTPNTFLHPNSEKDLGCVLMVAAGTDDAAFNNSIDSLIRQFPINSMTFPYIDDEVIICGYPGHIEEQMENRFFYTFSTFKHGYVTWKPSENMANQELSHIILVESNATFGNSGGPVFALTHKNIDLVGIVVGGYSEMDSVYSNNRAAIDYNTKKPLLAMRRSGVSIIESAMGVKELIEYVSNEIDKY